MDTTNKQALIRAGKAGYNSTGTGLSKLLVAIPLQHRNQLAQLAVAKGTSQQELIRFAIAALLEDPSQFTPAPKPAKTKPEPSILTGSQLLHADLPPVAPKPEPTLQESLADAVAREDYDEAARLRDLIAIAQRPPQPGPEYTWVNRGSGGYWRRAKRTGE